MDSNDLGRSAAPSGSRASHEAASSTASSPEASIPNAADVLRVLSVLREPTDAMLQPACEKHLPRRPMHDTTPPWPDERYRTEEECPRFVTRRRIWQSMVDAALASAIEAATAAETPQDGSVHESAVGYAETPNPEADHG